MSPLLFGTMYKLHRQLEVAYVTKLLPKEQESLRYGRHLPEEFIFQEGTRDRAGDYMREAVDERAENVLSAIAFFLADHPEDDCDLDAAVCVLRLRKEIQSAKQQTSNALKSPLRTFKDVEANQLPTEKDQGSF